jgi:FkbM family methyltransferase
MIEPALSLLPDRLARSMLVRTLLQGGFVFTLGSWLTMLRLERPLRRLPLRADEEGCVQLRVRELHGAPLYVRPRSTDWEAVFVSFLAGYHRPPPGLPLVGTVLDLGANVGATTADLAVRYPQARILGVELDAANAKLARRNTACWRDRVEILHGAVWTDDGTIAYGGTRGEWGYQVVEAMTDERRSDPIAEAPSFSMPTLIARLAGDGTVDFVKMDVEGAELALLEQGESWASRVRCIALEVHKPLDVSSADAMLTRLGFEVAPVRGIPGLVARR